MLSMEGEVLQQRGPNQAAEGKPTHYQNHTISKNVNVAGQKETR